MTTTMGKIFLNWCLSTPNTIIKENKKVACVNRDALKCGFVLLKQRFPIKSMGYKQQAL